MPQTLIFQYCVWEIVLLGFMSPTLIQSVATTPKLPHSHAPGALAVVDSNEVHLLEYCT